MNNTLQKIKTCEETAYYPLTVRVPVSITPFANLLDPARFRCGDPVVTPGAINCIAMEGESCIFTITQNICVEIPIEFGATAQVGSPFVNCGCPASENTCDNCGPNNDSKICNPRVIHWNSPNVII